MITCIFMDMQHFKHTHTKRSENHECKEVVRNLKMSSLLQEVAHESSKLESSFPDIKQKKP